MNRLSQLILLLLAAALLLLPHAAQAHKLSVFAWPEGGEIRGEVKFSGGRKAKNVQIAVQSAADHAVLAKTSCDENGTFRFTLPEQLLKAKPDLLIIANGGEGHRGEWLLTAQVAEEISRSPSPIRQSIAERLAPEPTLRDILGGIGCLFGLASLAAWAQSRRAKHS